MKMLLIILMLAATTGGHAQAKQDRVMLQQLALLKTYGSYLQKGYRIAKDGLSVIGAVKNGELNLHTLFYEGLDLVNPQLRNHETVRSILKYKNQILAAQQSLENRLADDLLYANEKEYIRRVMIRVAEYTSDDLETLYSLLNDNTIEADDGERLKRIDALEKEMASRYTFIRSFTDQTIALSAMRQQERSDVNAARRLYNLNPTP